MSAEIDIMRPTPRLNIPQNNFLAMPHKYRALVAGYGAGKTFAGCGGFALHAYRFPRVNSGYFAPTYPQIRDIFYPSVEEMLYFWGLRTKVREAVHEVDMFRGNCYHGTILCRSMDNPGSIVGFKIGYAVVDEVDVMTKDKAQLAWRKIIARMRYKIDGLPNRIDVTTTPEGFKFTYDQFVKQPRENAAMSGMYALVHASTYSNRHNLPADYIPSLLASYPPQLIDAYINGQFVNLQTGSVYSAYNRQLNDCRDTIQPGEILYIGMDFNVGKMAAVVHVKRDGLPRAVDEIVGGYDTPDMIRKIKDRYWRHDGRDYVSTCQIRIYPDASGDSRKSVNASTTDIAMLRNAGFGVFAHGSNPPVKDRINSMNAMFCNADGQRRYLVNSEKCPTYAEALQQQAWADNGEPDKTSGHDHANDGAGYHINYDYPINARRTTSTTISMR